MNRALSLVLLTASLAACKPPPPAPESLNEASKYMVRNFYADDATFGAGVQGFMDWYNNEGFELVGQSSTLDTTESFQIADLTTEDVAHLPLDAEIVDDIGNVDDPKDDVYIPRDPTAAAGVISIDEMDCTWVETEQYLIRPDQDAIFNGDWDAYERTYVTPRETFEEASASGQFTRINQPLEPFAEGFDPADYADTLLFTDNMVDPSPVAGGLGDIGVYPLDLDMRHGFFEVDGEERGVLSVITYNRAAAWGVAGANGLVQSYSIELNVQLESDTTLRMLAVWAEPRSGIIDPDSAFALNYAVNKSLASSERLSAICDGSATPGD